MTFLSTSVLSAAGTTMTRNQQRPFLLIAMIMPFCLAVLMTTSSFEVVVDGFVIVATRTSTTKNADASRIRTSGGHSSHTTASQLSRAVLSSRSVRRSSSQLFSTTAAVSTVEEATSILAKWDKYYSSKLEARKKKTATTKQAVDLFVDMTAAQNQQPSNENPSPVSPLQEEEDDEEVDSGMKVEMASLMEKLPTAVRILSDEAADERRRDNTKGRTMLGICAPSAQKAIATLKSWVTTLELPRGLLHGMDKDGVPIELDGGVYIKYNSGGVYTFEDIRKSGLGFEALWKPGDAMVEPYDGYVEGVYLQVDLSDGEFRQFLVPLNIFESGDDDSGNKGPSTS